jgi:hypothetical protein
VLLLVRKRTIPTKHLPGLEIENYDRIRNPLSAQPKENIVAIIKDEQLIHLSSDTSLY